MKVAIVHDWLVGGGAERVVQALHEMYPEAPIYTSYSTDEWRRRLDNKVVTGFLQHWPFSKLRKFIAVLRIWWFSHLDLSGYDLIISSSGNGEAFGIRPPKGAIHICYCHTPTHYYWRNYKQYMKQPGFGVLNPLARLGLRVLVGPLRRWDYTAAQRVDYFVANSTHIQKDIKTYYNRDSTVIHPPIDTARFASATSEGRNGFVTAGRQVPYKRIDLIVEACTKLDAPLKVIGRGPEHDHLMKIAGPTVSFLTNVSDAEMPQHFADAEAFLFAAFDDFGVTQVEALAAGTPLIAYRAGGALDYVEEGKTGVFFDEQSLPALRKAIRTFDAKQFKPGVIKQKAEAFSPEVFRQKMHTLVDTVTTKRQ
jgi:glycosyltransferase involved in cell wall biosynthesis